jgi:hypothetical protein
MGGRLTVSKSLTVMGRPPRVIIWSKHARGTLNKGTRRNRDGQAQSLPSNNRGNGRGSLQQWSIYQDDGHQKNCQRNKVYVRSGVYSSQESLPVNPMAMQFIDRTTSERLPPPGNNVAFRESKSQTGIRKSRKNCEQYSRLSICSIDLPTVN